MGGERIVNNWYGLSGLTSELQITCNEATVDNSELWHQRLGHLNYNDLIKIASKEVIKDLPKINRIEMGVCGPCQLGSKLGKLTRKLQVFLLPEILNFFIWISWVLQELLAWVEGNTS